jgi:hypothetical protein
MALTDCKLKVPSLTCASHGPRLAAYMKVHRMKHWLQFISCCNLYMVQGTLNAFSFADHGGFWLQYIAPKAWRRCLHAGSH